MKPDRRLDMEQTLKSLRLRFRFQQPPNGASAQWDTLQQEHVIDEVTREIEILNRIHHLRALAGPDSDWELDFCRLPSENIESDDPAIMEIAPTPVRDMSWSRNCDLC